MLHPPSLYPPRPSPPRPFRGEVTGAGVVVDEVEVLPSDPPQRPTSVPQALQQNMPLASVSTLPAPPCQLTATDRLLLWPCMLACLAAMALWAAVHAALCYMHTILQDSLYASCM